MREIGFIAETNEPLKLARHVKFGDRW